MTAPASSAPNFHCFLDVSGSNNHQEPLISRSNGLQSWPTYGDVFSNHGKCQEGIRERVSAAGIKSVDIWSYITAELSESQSTSRNTLEP